MAAEFGVVLRDVAVHAGGQGRAAADSCHTIANSAFRAVIRNCEDLGRDR
ncbi:hypothetical protein ACTMSW_24905 [Micromonospora sp. BQ11]